MGVGADSVLSQISLESQTRPRAVVPQFGYAGTALVLLYLSVVLALTECWQVSVRETRDIS